MAVRLLAQQVHLQMLKDRSAVQIFTRSRVARYIRRAFEENVLNLNMTVEMLGYQRMGRLTNA